MQTLTQPSQPLGGHGYLTPHLTPYLTPYQTLKNVYRPSFLYHTLADLPSFIILLLDQRRKGKPADLSSALLP